MATLTNQTVSIGLRASDWLVIVGWMSGQADMNSLPSPVARLAEAISQNVEH